MTEPEITASALSEEAIDKINQWLQKYPAEQQRSGILYALRVVQEENGGYLTDQLMTAVAQYLNIPAISVYEVATFYSMYDLNKVGKNKIKICTSISCMLRGSDKMINHVRDRLGVDVGETTPDGLFTLKAVECLAACGNAPVMQINDRDYIENITPEKVDVILDELQVREIADG
jgi:NADH-quinone oxidoreductase subunit E